MITFTGKGAFGGYAMGQILFYNRIQTGIKAHTVDDPISELERFLPRKKQPLSNWVNFMRKHYWKWDVPAQ